MLPYINYPFEKVGAALGSSPDELKLIFSFLLSYPLAGLLKRVPDTKPAYKNYFVIGVSLFYLVGLFDLWRGILTLFVSSAGAYALSYYMRASPYMPWIGFVFLMGHMSMNQIIRQFADDAAVVDVTGAQMVLVMKLTAFCWNVFDGTLPDDQLSDFQKDRRIVELPSFVDYAGYVMFFPALFAGPAFDYNEYKRWMDCTMFDVPASMDPSKKPPTRKKRKIPRSGLPAMWKMASGLLWIFAFLQCSNYFYPSVLLEDKFLTYSFPYRVFMLYAVGLTVRMKYYGVWSLTEGSCILTGLGYNGVDPVTGKVSWNRLQNIDPWGVETAQNSRAYLEHWNMNTNKWLRYYMYVRVTPRNKKPGFRASMATFATSALWHGFYPGYYLSFLFASFVQTAAKNVRRNIRPFFLDPVTQKPTPYKKYYDFVSWLTTQVIFSFVVNPFITLKLDDSLKVWSRVYFFAIIVVAGGFAFFASPAKAALRQRLEKRTIAAGVRMQRSVSTESVTGSIVPSGEPILGLSADMGKDLDEAIRELKEEVERRGLSVQDLKDMIDGKTVEGKEKIAEAAQAAQAKLDPKKAQ